MNDENANLIQAVADMRRSVIQCIVIMNAVQAALLITLMLLVHRPA